MKTPKILVTGATGATGGYALSTLQAAGHDVRVLVHEDDARAAAMRDAGIDVAIGDLLEIDTVVAALEGIEAAYFVYPLAPQILAGTVNFAQAARETGVKAIVNLSQITARRDSKSHAARDHWLAEQVLNWCGVPVTQLRPTLFAEWLLYPFSWQDYGKRDTLALPFGDGRFAPIASEDQGRVIAAILADPAPHAGKLYKLYGPVELDGYGIAAAASEALGRTIRYQPIEVEEFFAALQKMKDYSSAFFSQHLGAVAMDCREGFIAGTNNVIEELTGQPPITVQQFVTKNRRAFDVHP